MACFLQVAQLIQSVRWIEHFVTDRDAGNRHALDQHEGITLHDHAVGEGAAVALVGIAGLGLVAGVTDRKKRS